MKRLPSIVVAAVSSIVAVALLSAPAPAQSVWLEPTNKSSISLEVLFPQFKTHEGEDLNSVSLFMTGRAAVSEQAALVLELPWSQSSYSYHYRESDYESPSESSIGNIYFGGEFRDHSGDFITEVGIRLPSAPDENPDAQAAGLFSDLDRLPSFGHIRFAATAVQNYYHESRFGLVVRVRGGASFVGYSESDGEGGDIYIQYGGQIGARLDKVRIMGGFTGLLLATHAEGASFGERTLHQFGFTADYTAGQLHPGVELRLPLDEDLSHVMNYTVGFNVSYVFKQTRQQTSGGGWGARQN